MNVVRFVVEYHHGQFVENPRSLESVPQPFVDDDVRRDHQEVVGHRPACFQPPVQQAPDDDQGHDHGLAGPGSHLDGVAGQAGRREFLFRRLAEFGDVAAEAAGAAGGGEDFQFQQVRAVKVRLDQVRRVPPLLDLVQVNQGFHGLPLAEVVAERLAGWQKVIFLEPELKQPLGGVACARIAGIAPTIHSLPDSVHQQSLAFPPARRFFPRVSASLDQVAARPGIGVAIPDFRQVQFQDVAVLGHGDSSGASGISSGLSHTTLPSRQTAIGFPARLCIWMA